MKKLVPDPPPVLSVRAGLTHDEAVRNAAEHLNLALKTVQALPEQTTARHKALLSDTLINLQISRAMLKVALAPSVVPTPV